MIKYCPICQSPSYNFISSKDYFFNSNIDGFLYRCCSSKCGCLFIGDLSTYDFSTDYHNYYTHIFSLFQPRSILTKNFFSKLFYFLFFWVKSIRDIEKYKFNSINSPKNSNILDYGAGDGSFANYLISKGAFVSAFDPDPLSNVHNLNIKTYLDIQSISEKFDYIYLGHVIEHLDNPIEALSNLKDLLKPNGLIIVFTPNAHSFGFKIFNRYWRGLEFPRHKFIFTRNSFSIIAQKSGLKIVKSTTTDRSARDMCFVPSFKCLLSNYNLDFNLPFKFLGYFYQLFVGLISIFNDELGEEICIIFKK